MPAPFLSRPDGPSRLCSGATPAWAVQRTAPTLRQAPWASLVACAAFPRSCSKMGHLPGHSPCLQSRLPAPRHPPGFLAQKQAAEEGGGAVGL